MKWTEQVSVVIPVAPKEEDWKFLLKQLNLNENNFEVIVSVTEPLKLSAKLVQNKNVKTVYGPKGRAQQLNRGAEAATKKYLWFLHADSRLTVNTLTALQKSIEAGFQDVRYFDLGFFEGPPWMLINSFGVSFRSRVLRLPFGDQGFCLSRTLFAELGQFNEKASYGEDHLLIWKAHERGVPVTAIHGKILTSGRKYHKLGWFRTTVEHLKLTYAQAKDEVLRIRNKKQESSR